jgi:hypothetical protein
MHPGAFAVSFVSILGQVVSRALLLVFRFLDCGLLPLVGVRIAAEWRVATGNFKHGQLCYHPRRAQAPPEDHPSLKLSKAS